jgi:hypothetical protein
MKRRTIDSGILRMVFPQFADHNLPRLFYGTAAAFGAWLGRLGLP